MRISIAVVASADGKITKHNEKDIYAWVSREDQEHFRKLIAEHEVIIMGSGSYRAIRHRLKLRPGVLRLVLTSKPEQFLDESVTGQLEFSSETPERVVTRLKKEGYKKVLVVGGGKMMSEFLQAQLVDRVYLTIEPLLFGKGNSILGDARLDTHLRLKSSRLLNKRGTLLLTYEVQGAGFKQ